MHRWVRGLQEVELCDRPAAFGAKPGRAKGAKALGLRFQKVVEKALPAALHGQWIRFRDNNGLGHAQPDILFATPEGLCLVECKLTDTAEADSQMTHLYRPLLSALWSGPIHQIVVVKYLSPLTERSRIVSSWDAALQHSSPVLHAFSKRELAPPSVAYGQPCFSRSCAKIEEGAAFIQSPRRETSFTRAP